MRRIHLLTIGAVASALMMVLALPPWGLALLAPVALAPLLFALGHESDGRARFLTGWAAGFIYWAAVCHWIGDVLDNFGGLSGPLAVLAVVLFALAKGLHLAVFAWMAGPIMKRWWAVPAIALLWTGLERTHAPLGFPWLQLGNAGIDMALPLRLAPVVGVYGLTFVFAATATGAALAALKRPRKQLAWLAAIALLWALPAVEMGKAPNRQAAVLQPNFDANQAWPDGEKERMLRQTSYLTLAEALDPAKSAVDLVVWPEAPAPLYYYNDEAFRSQAGTLARLATAPFLFGTVAYTADREPLNSAVLLDARGRLAARYDKRVLVPFGEYVPWGFGWISKISSEAGNYAAGRISGRLLAGNRGVGVFICYESAFPHLVREAAAEGAPVLVNLTNDGYFGKSNGPRAQHLMLARMRAVENRRWLLRVANDGLTGSIDPTGRIHDTLPEFQRVAGRLRYAENRDPSPYARFGDWFAWSCLVLGAGLWLAAQLPVYRPMPKSPK
jgi:apolipoprotein N-acyltransferase